MHIIPEDIFAVTFKTLAVLGETVFIFPCTPFFREILLWMFLKLLKTEEAYVLTSRWLCPKPL